MTGSSIANSQGKGTTDISSNSHASENLSWSPKSSKSGRWSPKMKDPRWSKSTSKRDGSAPKSRKKVIRCKARVMRLSDNLETRREPTLYLRRVWSLLKSLKNSTTRRRKNQQRPHPKGNPPSREWTPNSKRQANPARQNKSKSPMSTSNSTSTTTLSYPRSIPSGLQGRSPALCASCGRSATWARDPPSSWRESSKKSSGRESLSPAGRPSGETGWLKEPSRILSEEYGRSYLARQRCIGHRLGKAPPRKPLFPS